MVELAQAEIIQIYRKRTGINQGNFGSQAFNTSYESGRTKMKNIELGRQVPTASDLRKMAALLNVPVAELMPSQKVSTGLRPAAASRAYLSKRVLDRFPGLDAYVDMLNKAARVNDGELLMYLGAKIAQLLKGQGQFSKQAAR